MPTTTTTTTTSKTARRSTAPKTTAEATETTDSGVSLKDPASLVKAYFRLRSKLLDKQEALALRVVDRAPKSFSLPKVDRAQVLKFPRRGQKVAS
jgi:hypothetical protein